MGRSRYRITESKAPHFVTCTVLHWIPVFTRPETVEILFSSLRFLQAEGLKVYAYVILENHLHMVVQSDDLVRDMARFKQFTAKACLSYLLVPTLLRGNADLI
ncbi:transposase [uncultured Thiomicrorhabdus sp.]